MYWVNYVRTWIIIKRKHLGRQILNTKVNNYTKFVILCQPRTGSNWLHTLLNSHPQIFSHGEILRRTLENGNTINTLSLQSLVFNHYQKQIKSVGLKLFYENFNNTDYIKPYQEIVDDENILIIHLTRKDILSQYVSLLKAEKTQVWSQSRKLNRSKGIQLDIEDFELFKKDDFELKNRMRKYFKNHKVFELSYEDLTSNLDNTLLKMQLFLHVKPIKLFSLLQKQSVTSLKEQITNWKDFEGII